MEELRFKPGQASFEPRLHTATKIRGDGREGRSLKLAFSLASGETVHPSAGGGTWWFRGALHLGDVLLADHMLSRLDLSDISGDEDATALTATVWLADKRSGFPLTTTGLEVPIAMCRQG